MADQIISTETELSTASTASTASLYSLTSPDSLISRVIQNSLWFFSCSIISRLLNLARGIVLTWLLTPNEFGLFGLAMVVIGFVTMFGDIGPGVFLIYRHDRLDEHVNTAFWVNIGVATLMTAAVAAASPLVSALYNRPELVPILIVLSLSIWFQIVSTIPRNLLKSQLRFSPIAISDVLSNGAVLISAVALAWLGYGIWALVIPTLIGTIVNAFLLHGYARWLPRWRFSRQSLKVLAPFSGWYLGCAFIWYLLLNIDKLLIGKFLGIEALGLYSLAYNYASLPLTLVSTPLGQVIYPELAKLQRDSSNFWPSFHKISRLLIGSVAPIACVLIFTAPDIFPLVFEAEWQGAILPFQILLIYMIVRCLWSDPFGALGRFDLAFWLGLGTCIIGAAGMYLALPYGIAGVAIAILIVIGSAHVLALYIASKSMTELKIGLKTALPHLIVSGAAAFTAWSLRHLAPMLLGFDRQSFNFFWVLMVFVVVFGTYVLWFKQYIYELVGKGLGKRLGKGQI